MVHNTCLVAAKDLNEWEKEDIFRILDNDRTDGDYGGADVRLAATVGREGRGAAVVPVEEWVRNYVLRTPPEVLEPRAAKVDYAMATKQSFQVARRSPPTPRAEWKGLEKARDCVARYRACQACCAATAASPRMQATSRPPPPASPPSPIRLRPRGPRHMPVDSPKKASPRYRISARNLQRKVSGMVSR